MQTIYVKVENIYYKEKEVFYKQPINTELHKATEYNSNYLYYYKENDNDTDEISNKYLGKFKSFSKYRSDSYFDDTNYDVIEFEKDIIFENKKENIYCKGIPDSDDENMYIIIEGMTYDIYPLYYKSY